MAGRAVDPFKGRRAWKARTVYGYRWKGKAIAGPFSPGANHPFTGGFEGLQPSGPARRFETPDAPDFVATAGFAARLRPHRPCTNRLLDARAAHTHYPRATPPDTDRARSPGQRAHQRARTSRPMPRDAVPSASGPPEAASPVHKPAARRTNAPHASAARYVARHRSSQEPGPASTPASTDIPPQAPECRPILRRRAMERILPKNTWANLEDMDIESPMPASIMITTKGIPDGPSGL